MKKGNVIFEKNGKTANIELSNVPFLRQGIGLMFTKKEKADALLFNFRRNTTTTLFSYFVYYPFIAIWLDENDKFIEMKSYKGYPFELITQEQWGFDLIQEVE